MVGDVGMVGKCEVCGKCEGLARHYFNYPIVCECHSPSHFYIVNHCKNCTPREPEYQQVEFKTKDLKNPIPIALDILRRAMKDKASGSYYDSWVANIACAYTDEIAGGDSQVSVHTHANNAAKKFIDRLLSE